jgi:hypothetical protein
VSGPFTLELDFVKWLVAIISTIVGSAIANAYILGKRQAKRDEQDKQERRDNQTKHDTLDDGLKDAHRKANAAHTRIDEAEKRLTRLEADNENTAAMLARAMGSLERSLEATNKRIDALLSQLASGHNGGHS